MGSSEVNAQDKTAFQQVLWNLYGVDERCNPPDMSINAQTHLLTHKDSCAIRIDKVMSCTKEAEGPYFNEAGLPNDPYQGTAYNSFKQYWNGITGYFNSGDRPIDTAQGGTTIVTGLGLQQIQGHALIIHDYEGRKIACGQLTTAGGTNPSIPDLTLAPTPTPR